MSSLFYFLDNFGIFTSQHFSCYCYEHKINAKMYLVIARALSMLLAALILSDVYLALRL